MESEPKTFEITIGERELSLKLGHVAVALFRHEQEVAYLAVDLDDEEETTLRVFNNPEFCEWLAGYKLVEQDGIIHRPVVRRDFNGAQMTFRELTGWGVAVVERERPNDKEMEMFLDINLSKLDEEWQAGV